MNFLATAGIFLPKTILKLLIKKLRNNQSYVALPRLRSNNTENCFPTQNFEASHKNKRKITFSTKSNQLVCCVDIRDKQQKQRVDKINYKKQYQILLNAVKQLQFLPPTEGKLSRYGFSKATYESTATYAERKSIIQFKKYFSYYTSERKLNAEI